MGDFLPGFLVDIALDRKGDVELGDARKAFRRFLAGDLGSDLVDLVENAIWLAAMRALSTRQAESEE